PEPARTLGLFSQQDVAAPEARPEGAAALHKVAATTAFSWETKAISGPADEAKAWACFPVRAGQNTSCRTPILRDPPAPLPALRLRTGTSRRMRVTGCALARAALRRVPTSALPAHSPPGWCWARWQLATLRRASSYGTTLRCSSRI